MTPGLSGCVCEAARQSLWVLLADVVQADPHHQLPCESHLVTLGHTW